MDTACVYLALADLPGIHTTGTLAAPTPAEFLPIKISIVETKKTGGKKKSGTNTNIGVNGEQTK